MKKRAAVILAALLLFCCGCSSEKSGAGGEFTAVISGNPENLDPQLANDKNSYYVIKNTFATLTEIDNDGRIALGAAESYTVSEDGLIYTFKIRDGLIWRGKSSDTKLPLTAYDYEYAFRRIFTSENHSPHTEFFSAIKGSSAYYGKVINESGLGVYAEDEQTLVIELEYPNCDFLKLLAHPSASPCNEELFLSTQGRYGLSDEDIFSCGAFYISSWNYDPYWTENRIVLNKISENSGAGYETFPESVSIEITNDRKSFEAKNSISVDAYTTDSISDYTRDVSKKYDFYEYINKTTILSFASGNPIAEDENARLSIAAAIDREKLNENLSGDSVPASRIFPSAITIGNKSIRELIPDRGVWDFGINPHRVWKNFIKNHPDTDFNSMTLLVCDSLGSEAIPYSIIDDFENNLDFYCTAVFENEKEYEKKLNDSDYDLCIYTVEGTYNTAEAFMQALDLACSNDADVLSRYTLQLKKSPDISAKNGIVSTIEDDIGVKLFFLPLSFDKEYLIYKNNISDLWYDPYTDVVYYKYAKKY